MQSTSRCGVAWCRRDHEQGEKSGHAAELGRWSFGDGVALAVSIGQEGDHEPVVRLTCASGERILTREISAELAGELARMLNALDDEARGQFVEALRQAADALDG